MDDGLFRFLMNNTSELILIFDKKGNIFYANQSAVQQLKYETSLTEHMMSDIFPMELLSGEVHKGEEALCGGEVRQRMLYRGNRTCFPAKVRLFAYRGESETWYICMAEDISNQSLLEKKANQADHEAEEAQKVKTEFVANVTHELRTPVNGILGNTRELLSMETAKEKLKLLQLVERSCNDMNAIINNILDFSKLEAGKFVLEKRKFHFRNMMEYVKSNHKPRITEKGLEFSMTVSPEIPEYIVGDELRIVQVLNNLISNAYKFTSVGEIHVDAVQTSQMGH